MAFINSINYNAGAAIAVQTLNATSQNLQTVDTAVASGKLVNGPGDNPAVWGLAQRTQSESNSLDAAIQSLQRNQSVNDTAVAAGQQVVDLLNQIKAVVVAATDPSGDAISRAQYQQSFTNLVNEINNVVGGAAFDGINLLQSSSTAVYALGNASGTLRITLMPQILAVGLGTTYPGGIQFTAGTTFGSATTATALLSLVNASIVNVTSEVGELGANDTKLTNQLNFVQALQQQLNNGVSQLLDADLAKESAKLQALQAQQQLGIQGVSIANQRTSQLIRLFG